MSTAASPNTTSSVRDFLRDDDDDFREEPQPRIVQQPENSAQRPAKQPESATIGADRQAEMSDFNPVLNGDQDEFDGETVAEPAAKAPAAPTGKAWKERVAAGEVKGYEHPNKGKNPDSFYRKKRNPDAIYHRRTLTEKDFLVLGFLARFEFITTKQVAILRKISVSSARRLMLGLQEFGMVAQEKIDFGQQLWYLTGKGLTQVKAALPDNRMISPLHKPGVFDHSKLRHSLAVSQVAAQIAAGTDTIRPHLGFDLSAGIDVLSNLVPERYIRSNHNSAMQEVGQKGGFKGGEDMTKAAIEQRSDIAKRLEAGEEEWNSALDEHPQLWTVVADPIHVESGKGKRFHPADLALNLEPMRKGPAPQSIAIEVELSSKTDEELMKIIRSYFHQKSPSAFAAVYYVSNQPRIATRVKALAQSYYDKIEQQEHLPKAQRKKQTRFRAVQLNDADGNLFSGKLWEL